LRLLLIEDDIQIASFLQKGLKESGFAVDYVNNGEDGLHLALSEPYDAAVIDVMLPKLDGMSVIKQMRQNNIKTPVIILSARGTVDDRVKGLQIGSDDYLAKPFAFSELVARLQALIRRKHDNSNPTSLSVGELSIDLLRHEVSRAGKLIDLQPREYALLEYMMRNANIVISKTMIMQHIWNYNFDPQTNVVDVLVCRVRNKIDKDFDTKMIRTVRGAGYILDNPQ
jgi:two-component system OmpR family response regulator